MKRNILNIAKYGIAVMLIFSSMVLCLSYDNPYGTESGLPRDEQQAAEENRIWREMLAAGYSAAQIWDQVYEELAHTDGEYGTGGKDGLLLNGTLAPNAPGNTSSGSTTSKCDHSYKSEVTKEATCAATGTTTYTCEKCGKTYTEKIPKTDHNFIVTEEVTGTCIEKGYRVETCTECGLSQTIEGIYGDHNLWVNGEQIEPTCEDPGLKTEQCKVCFEIFTTELPALGHEYETTPTIDSEAYCMMSGEKSNHCIRCDERTNIEKIPALGHEEVVEEKKAGIFTNGYLKITCARCGQVLKNDIYLSFVSTYKPFVIIGVVFLFGIANLIIPVIIKRRKKKIQ